MIGQYLPQINKNTTVAKSKKDFASKQSKNVVPKPGARKRRRRLPNCK